MSGPLLIIEDQGSNLDALPRVLVFLLRIGEGSVRNSPRTTVIPRVKALDQSHLIWSLAVLIVPSMSRIWLDSICLTLSIGVDQGGTDKIGVWDRMSISDTQRILVYGLDWAPDVDDLETLLDEFICFLWKMIEDAIP